MRFRLLRRRLTLAGPRVAVRSSMPWPLRWVLAAIVLGFCGAVALWAFDVGRSLAGVDPRSRTELAQLRREVAQLREERDRVQSISNTSESLRVAERAAQQQLAAQVRQLEAENRSLRDDLGFFERLIPASSTDAVAIRGLQAEVIGGARLRWQVLVIQPVRNAPQFKGRLELTFTGMTAGGRPWTMALPNGAQPLEMRQYKRLAGVIDVPADVVVKSVSARVLEGAATRALQAIAL